MPIQPGTPGAIVPYGDDFMVRMMEDERRTRREEIAAIAKTFAAAFADLAAAQADLTATQADLAAAQADLTATQADLAAAQADLTAAQADLAARISVTVGTATFNTGSLPNDSTFHEYGPAFSTTLSVPTGRLVVAVGCAEASLNAGGQAVVGEATFSISGGVASVGTYSSRGYLASADVGIGVPLFSQHTFDVTPGTYTVAGQMRAWAAGTATASVNFRYPFLTVQVVG